MDSRIDKILAGFAKSHSNHDHIRHLESDVWARIVAEEADQPVGAFEGFIAGLFPARHRFAPVMCAAVLGIVVGFGTLPPAAVSSSDAVEMLNFKVFKPKMISLASITSMNEGL